MLNFIKKKINDKKIAKELLKQVEAEEKEIEKELDKEMPNDKFSIIDTIDLLTKKSEEDIEYESYLTE